jgi:hypothetical protein
VHHKPGHYQREIERKLNSFERKVYRRILGPLYGNKKENWRILTDKETYAIVKKPTIIETIRLGQVRLGLVRLCLVRLG